MKNFLIFTMFAFFLFSATEGFSKSKRGKKTGVYVSKKYKGHTCPKPKKIINAKYF